MKTIKFSGILMMLVFALSATISLSSCGDDDGDVPHRDSTSGVHAPAWVQVVDLGLSVKWADMNIGASKPEDYGDYFAWGEITSKSLFGWNNYKWYDNDAMTKYGTVDNKTILDISDDAARANWGGSWRMPTREELDELRNECTWTWTTQNGVKGHKVTGPNGNSIFLPAAGYRDGGSLIYAGSESYYWSSSLYYEDNLSYACFYAYYLIFDSGDVDLYYDGRYYGRSVRAVCP